MITETTCTNFIGEEIKVGNTVVFLQNTKTGSSTIRKCKFIGTITDFKGDKVVIEPHTKPDVFVESDNYMHLPTVKIYAHDIICIIT